MQHTTHGIGNRGIVLLSVLLAVSVFLTYLNTMMMGSVNQQLANDRLMARFQALDQSQAAIEQLREDFFSFFNARVYGGVEGTNQGTNIAPGDAVAALTWLDALGLAVNEVGPDEDPLFDFVDVDGNYYDAGDATDGERDGVQFDTGRPRFLVGLPTVSDIGPACREGPGPQPIEAPCAWISDIVKEDPAAPEPAPRLVTIESQAQVGSVVKRLRAVYRIELETSDVFRYAYFINNYGWFETGGGASIWVHGEMRSNGDMSFQAEPGWDGKMLIHGDLFAAENEELGPDVDGDITIGTYVNGAGVTVPVVSRWGANSYWKWKGYNGRPLDPLVRSGQPEIDGVSTALYNGRGWHGGPQVKNENLAPQIMPYIGDLEYYEYLAGEFDGKLKLGGITLTVNGVYAGPDGILGNADDTLPLVLDGTGGGMTIEVEGPVVVPGDVLIKGKVEGQGTLYAGRNIHIIGEITYEDPPRWNSVERHPESGKMRKYISTTQNACDEGDGPSVGWVCDDGTYYAPIPNTDPPLPPADLPEECGDD